MHICPVQIPYFIEETWAYMQRFCKQFSVDSEQWWVDTRLSWKETPSALDLWNGTKDHQFLLWGTWCLLKRRQEQTSEKTPSSQGYSKYEETGIYNSLEFLLNTSVDREWQSPVNYPNMSCFMFYMCVPFHISLLSISPPLKNPLFFIK